MRVFNMVTTVLLTPVLELSAEVRNLSLETIRLKRAVTTQTEERGRPPWLTYNQTGEARFRRPRSLVMVPGVNLDIWTCMSGRFGQEAALKGIGLIPKQSSRGLKIDHSLPALRLQQQLDVVLDISILRGGGDDTCRLERDRAAVLSIPLSFGILDLQQMHCHMSALLLYMTRSLLNYGGLHHLEERVVRWCSGHRHAVGKVRGPASLG